MASFFSRQINFLKKSAEERPAYFWSLAIGFIGPIGVLVIPDIRRKYFGYEPPLPFPTTYPMMVNNGNYITCISILKYDLNMVEEKLQ
nr:10636_t:CDS:2 [Entrophospora candida]